MPSKTVLIKGADFPSSWALSVYSTYRLGLDIPASSEPRAQMTKDVYLVIEYDAEAIQQMLDVGFHALYPQKRGWETYREQFFPETEACQQARGFDYTYYQRLFEYPISDDEILDQIKYIAENLSLYDRNFQAITWHPKLDLGTSSTKPCLQRIHIRQLDNDTYEIILDWRSRDLFKAYQMNLIGIIYMINYYINNCRKTPLKCVKLVDKCDSAHIYAEDFDTASKVVVTAEQFSKHVLY